MIHLREKTQDILVFKEVYLGDEYGLNSRTFASKDVVIDIGAHIGLFALKALERGAGKVQCYEPDKDNFAMLKTNVPEADAGKVWLSNFPVWRSDRTENVTFTPGEHGFTAMGTCSGGPPEGNMPTMFPLDAILLPHGNVRLLKIDAEGAEFPILYTSRRLERVQEIVVEVHEMVPVGGLPFPCNHIGMVLFLESAGFSITQMRRHHDSPWLWLITAKRLGKEELITVQHSTEEPTL